MNIKISTIAVYTAANAASANRGHALSRSHGRSIVRALGNLAGLCAAYSLNGTGKRVLGDVLVTITALLPSGERPEFGLESEFGAQLSLPPRRTNIGLRPVRS